MTSYGVRNLNKGSGLLCKRVELRYDFIRQQMKAYPITMLCKVMEVSRSGYYKHFKREHKSKFGSDFAIIVRVRHVHSETRGRYDSRRMSGQLRNEGHDVGRYRARRLMKKG